jgi:excinuclease UvrABC nuclease subunit
LAITPAAYAKPKISLKSLSPQQKQSLANVPKSSGVYEFKQKDNTLYVGKATKLQERLKQHVHNNKLSKQQIDTIKTQIVDGSAKVRTQFERTRIKALDVITNGQLANKQLAPLSRKNQQK